MKRRVIATLLAACMVTSTAVGCGAKSDTQAAGGAQVASNDVENTNSSAETSVGGAQVTDSSAETSSSDAEDAGKGAGGKPWIDSDIKENVTADTVTDPADDFALYANKDWILANDIPDGYTMWSPVGERAIEVKKQCMDLLKDTSIKGHDAELVRTLNSLALDWDSRNKLGVSEIQDGYDKILDAKSLDDITKLLTSEDTVYDYYNFVKIKAETGFNDPEKNLVAVDTPRLLLKDSAEYSKRTENGDMNYGFNKDMFVFMATKLGMTEDEASRRFDEAIEMETKLASNIYTTNEKYSEDYYVKANNEMSFDELVSYTNNFPLKDIFKASGYVYDGAYLVSNPGYYKNLDSVYTDENLEDIKSLLIVDYVLGYSQELDRETYDKSIELNNKYFGTTGSVSDEEMAYNIVLKSLPDSMQIVYIQKYGSEEDRQKMKELCQEVIDTYRELLSENDWASDEVINYAIEKLDSITINAAYPDKFNDTSGIKIDGCTFIGANKQINLNNIKENIKLMGTKVDKEKWATAMPVTECNAFYHPLENSVNMILGMMGEPFYSSDMSVEELYASIAAYWVGHEVSHAFDSNGAQFDKDGQLRDWWPEEDKAKFQERIDKMDKYLDSLVAFDDKHFIGELIDTEMVADMTGLQCALRMASKVDGFDYKKFFIKYAQMNAAIFTYSSELNLLTQDPHPLCYSRVNVPVQQFEEFYEAFDVKEGDNMYLAPEDRLIVW